MVRRTTLHHYMDAPLDAYWDGLAWYPKARQWCADAAKRHNVPLRMVAGIVAALSQRMHWYRNLELAETTLRGDIPQHLGRVVAKALAIRAGAEPLDVLGGPKIRAFYRAILGEPDAIVIDSWMLGAFDKGTVTPKQYARLAAILHADARIAGLDVAQYQAIVWCTLRGKAD